MWRSLWWEPNNGSKLLVKWIIILVFTLYQCHVLAQKIKNQRIMAEARKIIRDEHFNIDLGLQGSFCDETHLKTFWEKVMMPDCVLAFFVLYLTSQNQSYSDRTLINQMKVLVHRMTDKTMIKLIKQMHGLRTTKLFNYTVFSKYWHTVFIMVEW